MDNKIRTDVARVLHSRANSFFSRLHMKSVQLDRDNARHNDRIRAMKPMLGSTKSSPFGLCKRDQRYEEHCRMLANQALADRIIGQQSTIQLRHIMKEEMKRQAELNRRKRAYRAAPSLALPGEALTDKPTSPLIEMIKRQRGI